MTLEHLEGFHQNGFSSLRSLFIIWWDAKLLIRPLRGIRPGEVTQNRIWIVPAVPEDPEPHDPTDELGLELLLLSYLRVLSVLRLDVRSTAGLSAGYPPWAAPEQPSSGPKDS